MTSDPSERPELTEAALVGRLLASGPAAGVGVDFADVAAEVARRRRVRRGWAVAGAATVTVAAVVGGTSLAARPPGSTTVGAGPRVVVATPADPADPSGPRPELAPAEQLCPPTHGPDTAGPVADGPVGFDPSSALVPDAAPDAVVVCRYAASGALLAAVRLGGPDGDVSGDHVRADLREVRPASGVTRPCPTTMPGAERALAYLHYGSGSIWLTASTDSCAGTASNGTFVTDASVASALIAAAGSGSWSGFVGGWSPADRCGAGSTGHRGTDTAFVPDDANAVTVCRYLTDAPTQSLPLAPVQGGRVLAAVMALQAQPLVGCSWKVPAGATYAVLIHSSHGPDQLLSVNPRCQPQVTSDRLQADDPAGTVVAAILAATGW